MFSRIKEVAVAVPCSESRKSASAHSPVEEGLVVKADDECGDSELVDRFPELPLDQHDLHLGLHSSMEN